MIAYSNQRDLERIPSKEIGHITVIEKLILSTIIHECLIEKWRNKSMTILAKLI